MLTKVSIPNKYAIVNIQNYLIRYPDESILIDRIQDNVEGYLIIKYKNDPNTKMFNYYLNKFYSHNLIQIHWLISDHIILKQIDSFDQNNWIIGNKLRTWVLYQIKLTNILEYKINSILGIGGEYYLYWVDYNKLDSYPKISIPIDLILINLAQLNTNIVQYISKIQFKKIILIICNLPDTKLQLLKDKFKILKIKYFKNYDNLIRIMLMEKKYIF
jgi:hypothetical protein